jgi:heme A synthase
MAKYNGFETAEESPLQWFCEKLANIWRVGQWAANGNMAQLGTGGCTFVVLFQKVAGANMVALGLHEHLDPDRIGKVVTGTHSLSFGQTLACFVLSFCLVDLQAIVPRPKEMAPPVWLLQSGCMV